MSDTVERELSNLDTPRSPVSISTESSQHGSSKTIHQEKNSEPPTPNSPVVRLTRKRAASLNTESGSQPKIGDLALSSASSSGQPTSDPTREQVCLCQPDPKIPRPRNAFILYRQHYQAQVVAQHPGLANPEISKIIGEQWRDQAPEVKSNWKKLAEEEKIRHQRQYPGYRYQPRRAGKQTGLRPVSISTADDPGRCPKCSGRYISTPNTPLTPITPGPGASQSPCDKRLLSSYIPSISSSRVSLSGQLERTRYPSQVHNVRMDSPRTTPPHQQTHRRTPYPPQHLHVLRRRDEDMELLSPSPELKRRRFTNEAQRGYSSSSSPISYSASQPFSRNPVQISATGHRQQQLPGPGGMLVRQGNMGPPPSQSPMVQQTPRIQSTSRSATFDESLRLPPLQTQLPSSTPNSSQRSDHRLESRELQMRSIEAMVMTIPYVNKIKVLAKISPSLEPIGPASPAREIRGAVIAVESADKSLLEEIGPFIHDYLSKDPSCAVKTWTPSTPPLHHGLLHVSDTEINDVGLRSKSSRRASEQEPNPFVEYLATISEWHKKSAEVIKYITTAPNIAPSADSSSPSSRSLPVALMSRGFSLTTSDTFALRIPINDSYAPVDHWQWMATLWRGIVGPDLTIYAKRVDKDEIDRCGGVEIREDCAGIIVRVTDSGIMDEKTARRLGFEVIEFVRSMEGGLCRH